MSRVNGELDDGVTDVCLRFTRGEGFFRRARKGNVQKRGYTGGCEERVLATGRPWRWRRHAILWKKDEETEFLWGHLFKQNGLKDVPHGTNKVARQL